MFSRNSMLRRQSAGAKPAGIADPLTASTPDTSEGQMVDAINRLELASDDPRATGKVSPNRAYGKHEMLKEIKSTASLPVDNGASAETTSFPSTGFSRSSTTRKVSKSFAVPRTLPGTPIESSNTTGRPRAPTSLGLAPSVSADTSDSAAAIEARLGLSHDSLGRRLWLYFQAAPELADLRDMIADSPTGVLVLSQAPYRGSSAEPDLGAILNDNVLFTDTTFSSETNAGPDDSPLSNSRKFTTASGICGVVDRGSVCALGMLPPMEDIMQAISDTDSPRTTIFDVLDTELLAGPPLLRLRVAAIHKACQLPDGRHVQVIVASAPLERTLVVDSALTTLSARICESLDDIYKALLPHTTESITSNDHIKVDIECIIQYAHAIELRAHARIAALSKAKDAPGSSSGGGAQRSFPWITGQRPSRSATPRSATPTPVASATADSMPAPNIDVDTESWQAHMLQLQDHISGYLSDLERETSMCGDFESRKKICTALVESVEKLATESIYANIFSPWFSDDRMRDEQFASKVAALNVANITLEHLGLVTTQESVSELHRICAETGRTLESMNGVKSPAEKLKLVVDAHKSVVERMDRLNERIRIAKYHQLKQTAGGGGGGSADGTGGGAESMSELLSADSILPLLIYSVVKANPPRFISNLRYIQRYRTRSLLTSQYEYCMTNAQAVASFVTSVDARKLGLSAEVSSGALERAMPPALVALQNLLLNNVVSTVGIDVVQGVADGSKKVAVGVFDATLGRLIDSSSQLIGRRAPWRSPSERELQIGAGTESSSAVADEKSRGGDDGVIEGVRSALTSASEQLSHEIKGHLPRASPRTNSALRSGRLLSNSLPPPPVIHQRFLDSDAGSLTINDVTVLLASYKELAAYLRE
ncbi:hypothetical protein GGI20_004301 [Coemansia sp. BCRC 34301]|nr:hypothetical protein GGI20_004301 [Coemansia sp. BCRC 34301]